MAKILKPRDLYNYDFWESRLVTMVREKKERLAWLRLDLYTNSLFNNVS
jgi:hypothetical protein